MTHTSQTHIRRLRLLVLRAIAVILSIAMWLTVSQADALALSDQQNVTDERLNEIDARVFAIDMLDTDLPSSKHAAETALTGTETDFSDYVETGRVEAQQQDLRQILITISSISGPSVQAEINSLIESGDSVAMAEFIESGWQQAQAQDDRAFAWEAAEAPDGSSLKNAADATLQENTPEALSDFATTGADVARSHDRRREVYELTNSLLPSVAAGASEAIRVGTDTAIEEFLRYGQFVAASQDAEQMEISTLVETAINEAATANRANKLAWQQADRAARATENARRAAEVSRDEALRADEAQARAGNAASAAADLANQSAHVADQAVAASQDARIALQQTADALSRAASAAGRARSAASAAQTAAAHAAGDASTARGARIAAEEARNAADAARRSAEAYDLAAESAGHARSAGQAANSAAANADAAAAAATDAANAAGVSEAAAAEAREGAARAREAAGRSRAAAIQVDNLVRDIESLVTQAKQAAQEAAEHAEQSAKAADHAAWEAENSAGFSRNAGEYAAEAHRAAEASNAAIDLAESAHALAETIDRQRYEAEKEFLRNQAEDSRAVQDAIDAAAAEEEKRNVELSQSLAQLEHLQDAATPADLQLLREAVVAAVQIGTPTVAGAAKTALAGGTNDDLRLFATSGYPTAVNQDNRAQLQQWWATDPNEDIRSGAETYANATPEVIDWFINDEAKTLRLPELTEKTWQLRETQGSATIAAADQALQDGGFDALHNFVNEGGYEKARYTDQLQEAYHLVENGGPEVKAAAEAAIVGDRRGLDEFITVEQYRRASMDFYRSSHNAQVKSMLETGRRIANMAGEIASNAQAAYEYSQGSAEKARQYADAAAQYAGFAEQASQRAKGFVASAQQSLGFAKEQQTRAHEAAASAESSAVQATVNADHATSYAIDARASANAAAESAMSARASAAAAGNDAALAAQAADEAFQIAVDKDLAEQAELQAGLQAEVIDGGNPEQPASLMDILKEKLGPAALDLILDLVGVTDVLNCFKGAVSGCLWTIVGILPIGKAAMLAKAAPALRKLVSKSDEIADALRSRTVLRDKQLDNVRNVPLCSVISGARNTGSPNFTFANYTSLPSYGANFLFINDKRCSIRSIPEKPFRGSSYYQLNATHVSEIGLHRHHIIAAEVIKNNPGVAATVGKPGSKGLNRSNAPAVQLTPEDHMLTESWGRSREAVEYRQRQEQLFREGNTDQIFQEEYDFLTNPQFQGRYDQALDEAVEYALKEGFITKRPTPRTSTPPQPTMLKDV